MTFKRKWHRRGELTDAELENAVSSGLRDPDLNQLLDQLATNAREVRKGNQQRDSDLEDRLEVAARQFLRSVYPAATGSDDSEIVLHLFAEVARRI